MSTNESADEAVELLQQLGLKQYEADCFVGLSRMGTGTAKQLSEITDVPRTRVYDAVRVLEAKGLVETQHSSPQEFRAVSLSEATETLQDQYERRIQRLEDALSGIDTLEDADDDLVQEVWSMNNAVAIGNRTEELITDAEDEVVMVVGDENVVTDELVETLTALPEEVDVLVGAISESLERTVADAVPRARTFVSGLGWLRGEGNEESTVAIGRLLLVDRSAILVSTLDTQDGSEHAVFGRGFRNGLVVISRRLMAQGLLPGRDPGQE